jgi:hypothetical protein
MAIASYDDLAYVNSIPIEDRDDLLQIGAEPLRHAAAAYLAAGHRSVTLLQAGFHDRAPVEILYLPQDRRAAVAGLTGPQWTVAESAQDALERHFGVEGKRMQL